MISHNMLETLIDYSKEHRAQVVAVGTGLGIAAVAAYRHFKPEADPDGNFYDFIGTSASFIREEVPNAPEWFMVGGGMSAVLAHPDTEIDLGNRLVIAPPDIEKARVRPNGKVVDQDIIAVTTDEDLVLQIRRALTPNPAILRDGTQEQIEREKRKPGQHVEIGVSPLKRQSDFERKPLLIRDFVSNRVEDDSDSITSYSWRIADIAVELPPESLESWRMQLNDSSLVNIPHPMIGMLSYPNRACHGVRFRDIKKMKEMEAVLGPVFGFELKWNKRQTQVEVVVTAETKDLDIFQAAIDFNNQKNALRFKNTIKRIGVGKAALLAAKIAGHRKADKYLQDLGQSGVVYKLIVSRASDEEQAKLWQD